MNILRWIKRKLRRQPHVTVAITADTSNLDAALERAQQNLERHRRPHA